MAAKSPRICVDHKGELYAFCVKSLQSYEEIRVVSDSKEKRRDSEQLKKDFQEGLTHQELIHLKDALTEKCTVFENPQYGEYKYGSKFRKSKVKNALEFLVFLDMVLPLRIAAAKCILEFPDTDASTPLNGGSIKPGAVPEYTVLNNLKVWHENHKTFLSTLDNPGNVILYKDFMACITDRRKIFCRAVSSSPGCVKVWELHSRVYALQTQAETLLERISANPVKATLIECKGEMEELLSKKEFREFPFHKRLREHYTKLMSMESSQDKLTELVAIADKNEPDAIRLEELSRVLTTLRDSGFLTPGKLQVDAEKLGALQKLELAGKEASKRLDDLLFRTSLERPGLRSFKSLLAFRDKFNSILSECPPCLVFSDNKRFGTIIVKQVDVLLFFRSSFEKVTTRYNQLQRAVLTSAAPGKSDLVQVRMNVDEIKKWCAKIESFDLFKPDVAQTNPIPPQNLKYLEEVVESARMLRNDLTRTVVTFRAGCSAFIDLLRRKWIDKVVTITFNEDEQHPKTYFVWKYDVGTGTHCLCSWDCDQCKILRLEDDGSVLLPDGSRNVGRVTMQDKKLKDKDGDKRKRKMKKLMKKEPAFNSRVETWVVGKRIYLEWGCFQFLPTKVLRYYEESKVFAVACNGIGVEFVRLAGSGIAKSPSEQSQFCWTLDHEAVAGFPVGKGLEKVESMVNGRAEDLISRLGDVSDANKSRAIYAGASVIQSDYVFVARKGCEDKFLIDVELIADVTTEQRGKFPSTKVSYSFSLDLRMFNHSTLKLRRTACDIFSRRLSNSTLFSGTEDFFVSRALEAELSILEPLNVAKKVNSHSPKLWHEQEYTKYTQQTRQVLKSLKQIADSNKSKKTVKQIRSGEIDMTSFLGILLNYKKNIEEEKNKKAKARIAESITFSKSKQIELVASSSSVPMLKRSPSSSENAKAKSPKKSPTISSSLLLEGFNIVKQEVSNANKELESGNCREEVAKELSKRKRSSAEEGVRKEEEEDRKKKQKVALKNKNSVTSSATEKGIEHNSTVSAQQINILRNAQGLTAQLKKLNKKKSSPTEASSKREAKQDVAIPSLPRPYFPKVKENMAAMCIEYGKCSTPEGCSTWVQTQTDGWQRRYPFLYVGHKDFAAFREVFSKALEGRHKKTQEEKNRTADKILKKLQEMQKQ